MRATISTTASADGMPLLREAGRLFFAMAPYLCTATVLLGSWQYASTQINPIFFPSPAKVLSAVWRLNTEGNFFMHVGTSFWRILAGFLLGSAVGIPVGVLMGMKLSVRWSLEPYVQFFRFIPAIAMVIFAISWFGSGENSKIFIIVFGTIFVVVLNAEAGVHNVALNRIRAAQCLGADQRQIFRYVILPSAVPFIFTGMRIAMGNAFATIISAELLASERGIGHLLAVSQLFLETDVTFVVVVSLGIMGFATDRIFRLLITRFGGEYVT